MTLPNHVDIEQLEEVFCLDTITKKQALSTYGEDMLEAGYRFPTHWKKPVHARQFIGWDGEGITYDGDSAQSYVLFGASTGDRIIKPSLGTADCFDLLLAVEQTYPDAIHVGFALQYDTNMMLRDLSRKHLLRIYYTHKCSWEGYRIEYRPGKWLNVRRGNATVRLFDVFGFFQSSFVTACEKFLSKDDSELVGIREGKAARQSFDYSQLDTFIIPYWEGELRLLVRLMDSLRDDLLSAGISVNSWHGPGAVANVVLRNNNIKVAKCVTPKEVNRAAQYAYAGGRFELFKAGHYEGSVWEYDINSAYPTAIAKLPNLRNGTWERSDVFIPGSYGVWRIRHDDKASPRSLFTKQQPLFYRDEHGNVSYPPLVEAWYWTPEAELVPEAEVLDGWVFIEDDDTDRPFKFVESMYEKRLQWKNEGNSAERALKLALNSLYGKMAQRIGYQKPEIQDCIELDRPIQGLPIWHQLEWAGYVTSMTRASLWNVLLEAGPSTIAVETDAVFTSKPLSVPLGEGLGQWEVTKFDSITYLQNGMYYATQDGKVIEKYRGFDKGSVPHDVVLNYLSDIDAGLENQLFGQTTRFNGLGVALFTKAHWRSWTTARRHVLFGGGGKRSHIVKLCPQCKHHEPFASSLHTLSITTAGGRSYPHALPWLSDYEPALRAEDSLLKW